MFCLDPGLKKLIAPMKISRPYSPRLLLTLAALGLMAPTACSKDEGPNLFSTSDDDGGYTSISTGAEDTGGIGGDDGGEKLDVAGDGDGDGDEGCRAADFLFVIDNSGSMSDEQSALISSFPKFIDAINENLDVEQDYHIMVTDVDAWQYAQCAGFCGTPFEIACSPLITGGEFTCD